MTVMSFSQAGPDVKGRGGSLHAWTPRQEAVRLGDASCTELVLQARSTQPTLAQTAFSITVNE